MGNFLNKLRGNLSRGTESKVAEMFMSLKIVS